MPKSNHKAMSAATQVAAAGAGAALGAVGPVATPLLAAGLEAAQNGILNRIWASAPMRQYKVWKTAAQQAGISEQQLDERLALVPGAEDVVMRTFVAAIQTGSQEKLLLFASVLAGTATSTGEAELSFESHLALAVTELDRQHFTVLRWFVRTPAELHLTAGPYGKLGPRLIGHQLEEIAQRHALGEVLAPLVAGLTRHGLVTSTTATLDRPVGGDNMYAITAFGRRVIERLSALRIWLS